MKLQKQLSRKVGNIKYAKWVITIPPKDVSAVGWNEGDILEITKKNKKLILEKK